MKLTPTFLVVTMMAWSAPGFAQQRTPAGYAEQPVAATYIENQTEKIAGTVVQVVFRDARSFVQLQVSDKNGQLHRWSMEWGPRLVLNREGVSEWTLRPGDRVLITGNPARNPEVHTLLVHMISRPLDGWTWSGPLD